MKRRAFSLVELLAVIAIIAILSAIIFPVFARARENAARSADLTAMNELRSALQLYRVDNGGYPPALLGYISRYTSGPQTGRVIPANSITGFLFPKRVQSVTTFKGGPNRAANDVATTAVWPNQDPRPLGSAPTFDVNGDGVLNNLDDTDGNRQAYGPTVTVRRRPGLPLSASNPNLEFYAVSGYDVANVRTGTNTSRTELRYTLFWSNFTVGTGVGFGSGSALDDPRQLGYSDPPDNTVITWNSFYRNYEASGTGLVPSRQNRDLVLFLGGAAKPFDSRDLHERAWRVLP